MDIWEEWLIEMQIVYESVSQNYFSQGPIKSTHILLLNILTWQGVDWVLEFKWSSFCTFY